MFGPESGRAIRYAHQHFLNMSASERMMLSIARCGFCKHGKITFGSGNIKTLKHINNMCVSWCMMKLNDGNGAS